MGAIGALIVYSTYYNNNNNNNNNNKKVKIENKIKTKE